MVKRRIQSTAATKSLGRTERSRQMKKGRKWEHRLISLVLLVTMIFSSFPNTALALASETTSPPTETEPSIVRELTEKRDQFTKYFLQDNQTELAVVSGTPLHYKDEQNHWQNIDNSLVAEKDEQGNDVLVNTKNNVKVSLPETLEQDKAVSITANGYSLSFVMTEQAHTDAEEFTVTSETNVPEKLKDYLDADSMETGVKYSDVLEQTNIEYTVLPSGIKESIIIKEKEWAKESYTYEINAPGLTAQLLENNSIRFFDAEGNGRFFMPAPYMFDSAETPSYSSEVQVSLEENGDGIFDLTYTPDTEWIQDEARVWPITIDPTVGSQYPDMLEYVNFYDPLTQYDGMLMKFPIPELPEGSVVRRAECGVYMLLPWNPGSVEVYQITSDWTYVWNNFIIPTFADYPEDSGGFEANMISSIPLNITNAVTDWYNNQNNYGLAFVGTRDIYMEYLEIEYTVPVVISEVVQTPDDWTTGNVTLTINASSGGVAMKEYSFDGGETWQVSNSKEISENGEYEIIARNVNNDIASKIINIANIDNEGPVISSTNTSIDSEGNILIALDAIDNGIGIKDYSFDNGNTWQESNVKTFEAFPEDLIVVVRDENLLQTVATFFISDIALTPNGWTNENVTAKIITTEACNQYGFDDQETMQDEDERVFTQYGREITAIARGSEGALAYYMIPEIKIDKVAPIINEVTYTNDSLGRTTVHINASDSLSGIKDYCFGSIEDENSWQTESSKTFTQISDNLIVYVRDYALNITSNVVEMTVTQNPVGWTNQPVTLTINASSKETSIKDYSFDGGATWQISSSKSFAEYQKELEVIARDQNNNVSRQIIEVKYDATPPEIMGIERISVGNMDKISVTASDQPSGIKDYSFDGGLTWQTSNEATFSSVPAGLNVVVRDFANNTSSNPIIISVSQTPDTWTTDDVVVTVSASSRLGTITEYSFDNGDTWQSSNTKLFAEPETHVSISAKDSLGNIGQIVLATINIDREPPEIGGSKTLNDSTFTINLQITDEQSGVNAVKWAQGIQDIAYFSQSGIVLSEDPITIEVAAGEEYTIYARDNLGNETVKLTSEIEEEGFTTLESQLFSNGIYMIKSKQSGKYLEVKSRDAKSKQPVIQYTRHCAISQKWKITYLGNSCYTIRPMLNTNYVLDVYGNNVDIYENRNADNSSIALYAQWRIYSFGDGTYRFMNRSKSGESLDVPNGSSANDIQLISYPNHYGDNQKFYVEKTQTLSNNTYHIKSLHSGRYIDASGSGTKNNTKAIIYNLTTANNQKWVFKYLNNGYYSISPSYATQLTLRMTKYTDGYYYADLYDAKTGAPPISDQWSILENTDGTYTFVSRLTEGVADVKGAYTDNKTPIISCSYHGGSNQKWVLSEPTTLSEGLYRIQNSYQNYLRANSNTSFTQPSTYDRYSGYELWYILPVGSGHYRIEHLGVRAGLGIYGNVLTANNSSLSLSSWKDDGTDAQLWHVTKWGSYYQLENCAYPTYSLYVGNSSSTPSLSTKAKNFSWKFSVHDRQDYWSGRYKNAPQKVTVNVIVDGTTAIYGNYTDSVYSIGTMWNNIDPNISINSYPSTYTGSYKSANFTIRVVGYIGFDDGRAGYLQPAPDNLDTDWTSAEIRMNMGTSEASGGDLSNLRAIYLHELGHGLKLSHPHQNTTDYRPLAIMNQKYWTSECSFRPSGHDKYNLRKKW